MTDSPSLQALRDLLATWRTVAQEWKRAEGTIPGAGFNAACYETCADALAPLVEALAQELETLTKERDILRGEVVQFSNEAEDATAKVAAALQEVERLTAERDRAREFLETKVENRGWR